MKNTQKETVAFKLELDRIEESKAVFYTEKKEEIILPKEMLPSEAKDGDSLFLTLATDEAENKQKEKKAREILNEILNIENK